MKTKITELLKIKYPIIQGGMAWVATARLAAAVSNAGGLGIIGAGNAPAEWVLAEVRKVKSLTDKPFGVNVMLLSPHVDEVMEVIIEERVPVITTGAGNPGKYIKRLKENNIKIIPVVASVALAKRLEKTGVDAVIAEGHESGGHIGELTTMALVPQVVDNVSIPVVAAGGIADGRGLVAALALGAQAVQIGTRFLCAQETEIHPAVKEAVIKAGDRDTVITGASTGHPVRVIKNKLARRFLELEQKGAPPEELEKLGAGSLRRCMQEGDIEEGSLMAGQIAGLIKEIKPIKEIIEEIISEAKEIMKRIARELNE
ncbi:enoyl-(acyl-carrier-protein) reductase II [Carboxydothermus islandicus]|uniref:Probable nitronate monooxygenase n=1 Tax=Carboxydothermus islandicus TaxID=661089 RepID=A0A1L8D1I5_9THEO|nr:enoyl-[acyl-carrier-protein] reductase FabK [Carboxydothermus islandicus]GAV24994.1 enoyl-(acyl-carrier-protein) reductase II [Carboxydothermus islandicus]